MLVFRNWFCFFNADLIANVLCVTCVVRLKFLATIYKFAVFRVFNKTFNRDNDGVLHLVGDDDAGKNFWSVYFLGHIIF